MLKIVDRLKLDANLARTAPPLSAQASHDLERSLVRAGCLSPLVADQSFVLIDGYRRLPILKRRRMANFDLVFLWCDSPADRRAYREMLNQCRGTEIDWSRLGRARGVICSSRQAHSMGKLLAELKEQPPGIVRPRKVKYLAERRRREEYQSLGGACPMPPGIHHCDFRELLPRGIVKPGTTGLILTDPPWGKASLPVWADLAQFAEEALANDGLLVAYLGTAYVPEKVNALNARLNFVSVASLLIDKDKTTHFYKGGVHVFNRCTFVAVFAKTPSPARSVNLVNVQDGTGREKLYHAWQQDLGVAERLIADLTTPADLIVDPFGGGFTFAVAAARMGRTCISCDIDEKACAVGRLRFSEVAQEAIERQ